MSNANVTRFIFPALTDGSITVFLDNAATTQKPAGVLECLASFYTGQCAGAGRSYERGRSLIERGEQAREKVAEFLGVSPENLVFTSGATESLNAVALAWGLENLRHGDEIMLSSDDHKSTVLPWFNVARILRGLGKRIKIVDIPFGSDGKYDLAVLEKRLTGRTRLIALTHVHHVYGLKNDIATVRKMVGKKVLISLDASQSVGRCRVDARELGADFISFSGHKMFAANGAGILYVAPRVVKKLGLYNPGGGTPAGIVLSKSALAGASLQEKLESGTPDIPALLSFLPAIELIENLDICQIESRLAALTAILYRSLSEKVPGIVFAPGYGHGGADQKPPGLGILSFHVPGIAGQYLSSKLDELGILVRGGKDEAISRDAGKIEPDHYMRVSLHIYNDERDIARLVEGLSAFLEISQ